MNQLTLEWIQKAEGDYDAIKLHRQVASPNFDFICFHAQQCIEKYLKAWLQEANIRFSKTHDLESLLDLIVPTISAWDAWRVDFSTVSDHAVDFRYPGKAVTAENAQHAVQICNKVRQAVRSELKLS
ncbi:HEPN domain-containing protein [Candidatus Poribacteria bacterium]|nr:HEPN domain-containing protein [Candidatus Poribacteria bacterium]